MRKLINYWHQLTAITQQLYIILFINLIINLPMTLIVGLLTKEFKGSILFHTAQSFTAQLFFKKGSDSWMPMSKAFDYLQSVPQNTLYQEIFFTQRVKFQYPPSSLLVYSGLQEVKQFFSEIVKYFQPNGISWTDFFQALSWIFVLVTVFMAIKIFNLSLERNSEPSLNSSSKVDILTRNILLVCLSLTFYPVIKAYTLGQIQTWLNCMFAIVILLWMQDKKQISGILTGIMCLIKPQYAIILLWGIVRKQWSFVLSFVFIALTGLLISIFLFGIENHIEYVKVLKLISQHGEAYYSNQSVNGLLHRLLFNGNNLQFEDGYFPPFNLLVYLGTVISSAVLIGVAIFLPRKTTQKESTIDFCIIGITSTMASPVAWEHHYGILLPIYAFLVPYLLKKQIFGKMTIPYLCLSYILCSNNFSINKAIAHIPLLNIFQSYLFAGSLMVLGSLYILNSRKIDRNSLIPVPNKMANL